MISDNDDIVGIEPKTEQPLFESTDDEKDFYTVSELIKPEYYFENNKDIKIKDFNDNCKKYINNNFEYHNCMNDNLLYSTTQINDKMTNIYSNDKIENGSEFYIGNNIVKAYENDGFWIHYNFYTIL